MARKIRHIVDATVAAPAVQLALAANHDPSKASE
jgi:hypothetical protein